MTTKRRQSGRRNTLQRARTTHELLAGRIRRRWHRHEREQTPPLPANLIPEVLRVCLVPGNYADTWRWRRETRAGQQRRRACFQRVGPNTTTACRGRQGRGTTYTPVREQACQTLPGRGTTEHPGLTRTTRNSTCFSREAGLARLPANAQRVLRTPEKKKTAGKITEGALEQLGEMSSARVPRKAARATHTETLHATLPTLSKQRPARMPAVKRYTHEPTHHRGHSGAGPDPPAPEGKGVPSNSRCRHGALT